MSAPALPALLLELTAQPTVRPSLSPGGREWVKVSRRFPGATADAVDRLAAAVGGLDLALMELLRASDGYDLFIDQHHGGGVHVRSCKGIEEMTIALRASHGIPTGWVVVAGPTHDPEHIVLDSNGLVLYGHEHDSADEWRVVEPSLDAFLRRLVEREGDLYWWDS